MSETKVKHADEIFKSFKTQSVSNSLKECSNAGYTGKLRSLTILSTRGLNSLDACEARFFQIFQYTLVRWA